MARTRSVSAPSPTPPRACQEPVPAGIETAPTRAKRGGSPLARSLTRVQALVSTVPVTAGLPRKVPSAAKAGARSTDRSLGALADPVALPTSREEPDTPPEEIVVIVALPATAKTPVATTAASAA